MSNCAITVLMPVYNAEKYLSAAIESVLAQSFEDFEFIIVVDGPTDNSHEIAKTYARTDSRIRIFEKENSGISDSLNLGLSEARGEFIARLDADDIMHRDRLRIQFDFLSRDPTLGFCGSFFDLIDAKGARVGRRQPPPVTHADFDELISKRQPMTFTHPSIMCRRSAMIEVGGYDRSMEPTEDTDLFNKIIALGYQVLIIPQYLLKYRLHSTAIGARQVKTQIENRDFIAHNLYARLSRNHTVSREEYAKIVASRPFLHRALSATEKMYFVHKYRSLYDYANGQYLMMTIHLAFALLLRPNRILRRGFIVATQVMSYPFMTERQRNSNA